MHLEALRTEADVGAQKSSLKGNQSIFKAHQTRSGLLGGLLGGLLDGLLDGGGLQNGNSRSSRDLGAEGLKFVEQHRLADRFADSFKFSKETRLVDVGDFDIRRLRREKGLVADIVVGDFRQQSAVGIGRGGGASRRSRGTRDRALFTVRLTLQSRGIVARERKFVFPEADLSNHLGGVGARNHSTELDLLRLLSLFQRDKIDPVRQVARRAALDERTDDDRLLLGDLRTSRLLCESEERHVWIV